MKHQTKVEIEIYSNIVQSPYIKHTSQYAFGENDCYHVSKAFFGLRQWLQKQFQIGLPLICGRMCTLIPIKVQLHMEVS